MLRFVAGVLLFRATLPAQSASGAAQKAFDRATQAAKRQQISEAVKEFQAAISADPKFAEAWFELGELQAEQNNLAEAAKSYAFAIQANPDYPEPYRRLALLQQSVGDWQGLAMVSDRLLKIDPGGRRLTYLFHAVAHFNLKDLDVAEQSAREVQKLDPQHKSPIAWKIRGEILFLRHNYAESEEQFRKYLEFVPDGAEAAATRARLDELEKLTAAAKADPTIPSFRAQTDLALVRFQFTPKPGQLIADLRAEDIEVRENGAPRKVVLFEGGKFYPRILPLEITLLFDTSESMRISGMLNPSGLADSLFHDSENENVSVAVYTFATNILRLTAPTRYGPALKAAMDQAAHAPTGGTPLFDAIIHTAREAAATGGKAIRMLVVISDGQSTSLGDLAKFEEAARTARELGVAVYPVLVDATRRMRDATDAKDRQLTNAKTNSRSARTHGGTSVERFVALADATGGESFNEIAASDTLGRILGSIAKKARYDYVAGYYPSSESPVAHKAEVVLRSAEKGRITGGTRITTQ